MAARSGPEGIRTPDLVSAIDARSQLRHRPNRLYDIYDMSEWYSNLGAYGCQEYQV